MLCGIESRAVERTTETGYARQTVLAIDLGAESGRVMAVHLEHGQLRLENLNRFANVPKTFDGTMHWDVVGLWREIKDGIRKASSLNPRSIGVDAWGVDFALLDERDQLVDLPVHYRDPRTNGMMEAVFSHVSRADVFEQTGIQFLPINTIYQMMSLVAANSPQLAAAHTFLTMPDLFHFWLGGQKVCEFTNATTTQLYNPRARGWATSMMDALEIPRYIFPEVVQSGTRLGMYEGIPVIAPASHDTGSAVIGIPLRSNREAYISSGTWSLVGMEMGAPIINERALTANMTNEGGAGGTTRLLKNVMGLWIIQQCRATWESRGQAYSYAELVELARVAPQLQSIIDPNDVRFLPPGDHPQLIQNYCAEHGQPVPQSPAEIVRCVLESLARAYRGVIDILRELTGIDIEMIHIVGGGSQNTLLCQMTANATGLPVVAGPVESTVIGNALVQLIALGEISGISQARAMVANMSDLVHYEPHDVAAWNELLPRVRT